MTEQIVLPEDDVQVSLQFEALVDQLPDIDVLQEGVYGLEDKGSGPRDNGSKGRDVRPPDHPTPIPNGNEPHLALLDDPTFLEEFEADKASKEFDGIAEEFERIIKGIGELDLSDKGFDKQICGLKGSGPRDNGVLEEPLPDEPPPRPSPNGGNGKPR